MGTTSFWITAGLISMIMIGLGALFANKINEKILEVKILEVIFFIVGFTFVFLIMLSFIALVMGFILHARGVINMF